MTFLQGKQKIVPEDLPQGEASLASGRLIGEKKEKRLPQWQPPE